MIIVYIIILYAALAGQLRTITVKYVFHWRKYDIAVSTVDLAETEFFTSNSSTVGSELNVYKAQMRLYKKCYDCFVL